MLADPTPPAINVIATTKKVLTPSFTSQRSGCQRCFDLNAVCSFLCDKEYDDDEADGSCDAISWPPDSLSPHDIKSYGVRAEPSYQRNKRALSGISDFSLCPHKESDDGEANGSSCVIIVPPESFYSQDIRTSFVNRSLHPKFGLLIKMYLTAMDINSCLSLIQFPVGLFCIVSSTILNTFHTITMCSLSAICSSWIIQE